MRCLREVIRNGASRLAWEGVSFAVASILLAGCARTLVGSPLPPPPPVVTAEELVTLLRERGAAIQTMKAQLLVEATGGTLKGTQRMEAALVYQRPGSIRLQTFARIGFPVFDLRVADDHYHVTFPMSGKSVKGDVAELGRQASLGTPITLGLQATLGNLSGFSIAPTDQVALREEGGLYVLDVIPTEVGATGSRRLWFDRGTLEVLRQDFLEASGQLTATMLFQDYRAVGPTTGVPLMRPYLVRAEDVRSQAVLVLTFREIIPNPELTPRDWGRIEPEPLAEQPPQKGGG